jgi:hypothetical protein
MVKPKRSPKMSDRSKLWDASADPAIASRQMRPVPVQRAYRGIGCEQLVARPNQPSRFVAYQIGRLRKLHNRKQPGRIHPIGIGARTGRCHSIVTAARRARAELATRCP